jgi:hypothetical protein
MLCRKAFVGRLAAQGASEGQPPGRRQSMIDEMWMRGWAENHGRFSADLDRGFARIAGAIARLRRRRDARDIDVRRRIGV